MKLVTFVSNDESSVFKLSGPRVGALVGEDVVDLFPSLDITMRQFLEGGSVMMAAAKAAVSEAKVKLPLSAVKLLAPILAPEKIVCIGLNYADHAEECGAAIPERPVVFSKYPTAICGPGDSVVLPKCSTEVDYEVELVVVIGEKCKGVSEADAMKYVAGYTVGNDVSARDWQMGKATSEWPAGGGGQWMSGKTFDTFAPIGPAIVTADEVPDPHALFCKCTVNGEVLQDSTTAQLIFKIPTIVSFLSGLFTLSPGDIIFTGTPPGVGMGRKPQKWMKAGDVMTVEIEGLGSLTNTCVEEQ
jgi:2-keto-4-pentenoate hydratase/2-oxohepta-3-ene-1,7-dioic acid hydratase in catechol pathway